MTQIYTQFLIDISLLDLSFNQYLPSWLAVAALIVAWRKIKDFYFYVNLDLGPNKQALKNLIEIENLNIDTVMRCADLLEMKQNQVMRQGYGNEAIKYKYSQNSKVTAFPLLGLKILIPSSNVQTRN